MTNTYIGVNSKAQKIKNMYIGISNKARKIKKAYIGVNGKARLFYSSGPQLIQFTSSVVPTLWQETETDKSYSASNTYGTWNIYSNIARPTNNVSLAFDTSTTTAYSPVSSTSSALYSANIICPDGITICPKTITVTQKYCGSSSYPSIIQASEDNTVWDNLGTLTRTTSSKTESFSINTTKYYKYFRVNLYRYSTNYSTQYLYDFKITSGTLKIE